MNQPGKSKPNANLPLQGIAFIRFLHLDVPLCYLNFGGTGAFKLQALTAQQVKRVSCLFIFWHKVWEPPYFNNVTQQC